MTEDMQRQPQDGVALETNRTVTTDDFAAVDPEAPIRKSIKVDCRSLGFLYPNAASVSAKDAHNDARFRVYRLLASVALMNFKPEQQGGTLRTGPRIRRPEGHHSKRPPRWPVRCLRRGRGRHLEPRPQGTSLRHCLAQQSTATRERRRQLEPRLREAQASIRDEMGVISTPVDLSLCACYGNGKNEYGMIETNPSSHEAHGTPEDPVPDPVSNRSDPMAIFRVDIDWREQA